METKPRRPSSHTRRRRPWQEGVSSSSLRSTTNTLDNLSSSGARSSLRLPYFTSTNNNGTAKGTLQQSIWTGLLLFSVAALIYLLANSTSLRLGFFSRHDGLPLLIPGLMRSLEDEEDVGGWLLGSPLHYLPPWIKEPNDGLADYGGLIFLPLDEKDYRRVIRKNDWQLYHQEKKLQIHEMDEAEHISKRHWFDDEMEDIRPPDGCRRPNWEKLHFPTCNTFHALDLSRPYDAELAKRSGDEQDGKSFYLSHGYFRDVFSISKPPLDSKAVLKVARYTKHEMNYRPLFNAKRDALIMERLSASPRIVDIYGHCGASVIVENLPHEVEEVIVPGGGWIKQEDLHDSQDVDIQNHYTVEEKLDIALAMAESIAELHGFKDGAIVHDDIQLCQWLRNDQGNLKLGDFNRARVLAWNDKEQRYCKYDNGRSYGNYRSPEEYGEKLLSQQHDVWSFGNNIYALLTGLWIFYDNEDDQVVADKVVNGTRPFIDPRYRKRSVIEGRLVEIMEKCWVYDLDQRPDIFEILKLLQQLKKENDAREKGK